MNERIKELAIQAKDWAYADHDGYTAQMLFEQKFAELIIKDCIEAIQNESMALKVDELEYGLRIAEGAILDHFGVEK